MIPRTWKVIQTVREKFACRDCETITQPPAPFHVVPRGWAGPSFLAMLLFEKYGQHQPLNRQADRFAREGVPLSTSTLADQVGAAAFALMPIYRLIEAHILAAERLHGDDTTVPVMARGKTDTARLWIYVRDDRPFAGPAPPAALFHYSRDRRAEHPTRPSRHLVGGPAGRRLCRLQRAVQGRAHARACHARLAVSPTPGASSSSSPTSRARRARRAAASTRAMVYPIALGAVQKLDALFEIERTINGRPPAERIAVRKELSAPLMDDLHSWLTAQLAKLSRNHELAKA